MNNEKDIQAHSMTLFWSSRSPFVRKVMVVAHEAGLAGRIVLRRVNVSTLKPNADVVAVNAIGRIPVLRTPGGQWLADSRVIAEYLDAQGGGALLFPAGPDRWRALAWQAEGDALMVTWWPGGPNATGRRAPRSHAHIEAYRAKLERVGDALEARAVLATAPFSIGHIALGCALAYADFRFEAEQWRDHRPGVAAWHAAFSRRPSVVGDGLRRRILIASGLCVLAFSLQRPISVKHKREDAMSAAVSRLVEDLRLCGGLRVSDFSRNITAVSPATVSRWAAGKASPHPRRNWSSPISGTSWTAWRSSTRADETRLWLDARHPRSGASAPST